MKKLIIVLGLIFIIAATTVPSWAEGKLIYVCYLDKSQRALLVDAPNDCLSPGIVFALRRNEPQASPTSEKAKAKKKHIDELPSHPDYPFLSGMSFSTSP
jgi:hypothetical protein